MNKPRKTPTKEQKAWMKESGYTESQLDSFWNENIGTNAIVRNLNANGMTWRDMNLSCVKQLPTQRERDLKALSEKAEKERAGKEAEEKKRQEKKYYADHFEEIMVSKIEHSENLSREELSTLVYEYDLETEHGENRRWTRSNTTIVKLRGRYFSIDWEEGLTEFQKNEFYSQPIEVTKKTYEKTITVTKWVPV